MGARKNDGEMEKVEQKTLNTLFVNNTDAHDDAVSIIQGTTIHFVERAAIPELIISLAKYMNRGDMRYLQEQLNLL